MICLMNRNLIFMLISRGPRSKSVLVPGSFLLFPEFIV